MESFLAASRLASAERRSYKRIAGHGLLATLTWKGQGGALPQLEILNISRGGMLLRGALQLTADVELMIEIPGVGRPVAGRVVRATESTIGLMFHQHADAVVHIDHAVQIAEARGKTKAA